MKVEISVTNESEQHRIYDDVQDWDTCETTGEVFKAARREFGRCKSTVYIDKADVSIKIGWFFEKRRRYADCKEYYIQGAWITPLRKYETRVIRESAMYKETVLI